MDVQTFELKGATINGVHVNLRGWLYYRTEDHGRTSWDATATASDLPKALLAIGGQAAQVSFETGSGVLDGESYVTIGATVVSAVSWPLKFVGTGDLEGV